MTHSSQITVGFIGTGNMGSALAFAAAGSGKADLLLTDHFMEAAESLAAKLKERNGGDSVLIGISGVQELIARSDFIFIGVKPQSFPGLAGEIKTALKDRLEAAPDTVVVSMMAGTSMERISGEIGFDLPIIRIMPNLPAATGQGTVLYTNSGSVSGERVKTFLDLMAPAGIFVPLEESLFSAGSAVSGCGPAFVSMFIEALADGGVACGLPRATALKLAMGTVKGTAAYIGDTELHPDVLKDRVCSPGGTTIEGVLALEEGSFRSVTSKAVIAACSRDKKM